jgi:hypothetical protein
MSQLLKALAKSRRLSTHQSYRVAITKCKATKMREIHRTAENITDEQIMESLGDTIKIIENLQNRADFLLDIAVQRGLVREWGNES